MTSTVSIQLGIYAAILSFLFNLIFLKKLIILLTLLLRCFQLRSSLNPFSLMNVIALSLLFFESKFSEKFNFDLGKNLFL